MAKNTYWVADPEGIRAPVEGADVRDRQVRMHGWTESTAPDRDDRVWLHNVDSPELGRTHLTWEAAQLDAWSGRGWVPGLPPEEAATETVPAEPPAKSSPATKSGQAGNKNQE